MEAAAGAGRPPEVETGHARDVASDFAELNRRAHAGRGGAERLPGAYEAIRRMYRAAARVAEPDLAILGLREALQWADDKADAVRRAGATTYGEAVLAEVPNVVQNIADVSLAAAPRVKVSTAGRLRAIVASIEPPSSDLWRVVLVAALQPPVWAANAHLADKLVTLRGALFEPSADGPERLSALAASLGVAVAAAAKEVVRIALLLPPSEADAFWSVLMHACGGRASPGLQLPVGADLRAAWNGVLAPRFPKVRHAVLYEPATAQLVTDYTGAGSQATSVFEGITGVVLYRFLEAYVGDLDDGCDRRAPVVMTAERLRLARARATATTTFEKQRLTFIAGALVRALDTEVDRVGRVGLEAGLHGYEAARSGAGVARAGSSAPLTK